MVIQDITPGADMPTDVSVWFFRFSCRSGGRVITTTGPDGRTTWTIEEAYRITRYDVEKLLELDWFWPGYPRVPMPPTWPPIEPPVKKMMLKWMQDHWPPYKPAEPPK
jgi:hypothetical protein